jgi:phage-related protein
MYKIEFYNENAQEEINLFPEKIKAKAIHIFELVKLQGANLGMPFTKPLNNGLFEIRAKGEEGIGRSIYCYQKGKTIIILHSFIKKDNKIPKKNLSIAMNRMKNIK